MLLALSLISGPLPIIVGAVAFTALATTLTTRTRRRWWLWPALFVGSVAAIVVLALAVPLPAVFGHHFPPSFYVWVALPVFAASTVAAFWRSLPGWRRVASLLAVPMLVAFGALEINMFYGYMPTLAKLLGHPPPGQVPQQALLRAEQMLDAAGGGHPSLSQELWRGVHRMVPLNASGITAHIDIPATVSRFHHRKAWVWLPPAWRPGGPALPVVVLLPGAPGTPSDWLDGGNALAVTAKWAATHAGIAPILVVPDQNGSAFADSECVDTPTQRADTYLAVDVPRYVIDTFGASPDPAHWAVAGLSEGGTCAIDLALRHPNTFGGFADFGGSLAPSLGDVRTTLRDLFGGSAVRQRAYDPLWLLRTRRCGFAWFDAGASNRRDVVTEATLARAARAAGLDVVFRIRPGGHTFWEFRPAFADSYPWLAAHLQQSWICRALDDRV
jgi:S-formylglutathione hydrolase FrmB